MQNSFHLNVVGVESIDFETFHHLLRSGEYVILSTVEPVKFIHWNPVGWNPKNPIHGTFEILNEIPYLAALHAVDSGDPDKSGDSPLLDRLIYSTEDLQTFLDACSYHVTGGDFSRLNYVC